MYSDALHILDENTANYMIDELKAELSAQKAENEMLRALLTQYQKQEKNAPAQ